MSSTAISASDQIRWLFLLQGVLATVVGLGILIAPAQTLFVFVLILGSYWFVRGLAMLLYMIVDRTKWGWKLFVGIFGVLAGVAALLSPMAVGTGIFIFIVYFIGVQALLTGATEFVYGFQNQALSLIVLGALSFLLGLGLVFHPLLGMMTLALVLGVVTMAGGVFAIITSLWPVTIQRQLPA